MFKPALKVYTKAMSSSYYIARFRLLEPLSASPRPLQFVNIWIPRVDEVPMSISDYNEVSGELTIIFKVVGEGTKWLRDGSGFYGIKGPLGRGVGISGYRRVLFVAGGTGIAPLPLLARKAEENGVYLDVLWGVRSGGDLFDVRSMAKVSGEVYVATEDCSRGFCGKATDALPLVLKSRSYDLVIAVGPKPMLKYVCSLAGKGTDILVLLETIVKCGLGACGCCTVKPKPFLLCTDGPAFRCNEVVEHLEQA